jgi:hypothetical protein
MALGVLSGINVTSMTLPSHIALNAVPNMATNSSCGESEVIMKLVCGAEAGWMLMVPCPEAGPAPFTSTASTFPRFFCGAPFTTISKITVHLVSCTQRRLLSATRRCLQAENNRFSNQNAVEKCADIFLAANGFACADGLVALQAAARVHWEIRDQRFALQRARRKRQPQIGMDLVPDLEGALLKCQWWHG